MMSKSDENTGANPPVEAAKEPEDVSANTSKAGELATISDEINLKKLNVIGIFGTDTDLGALLRSPTGRIVKVKVGDRAFGGRVVGIDRGTVRLLKSKKNMTLKLHNS
jgi:hypothetical protein